MELNPSYTTLEIEKALHIINNVLLQKNKEVSIAINRTPEDGGYSIKFTQEFVDDVFALAMSPTNKKEKFIIIEYDTMGGIAVAICRVEDVLGRIDELRQQEYTPRIVKIIECHPILTDLLDQEILHKMIYTANKESKKQTVDQNFMDMLVKEVMKTKCE